MFNGNFRFRRDLLDLPLRVKTPTTWAVWTDLFGAGVHPDAIGAAFNIMKGCSWHRFLVLTKRPKRAALATCGGPVWADNIWIGTTVESMNLIDRLFWLSKIPAMHRFVSVEPMLEPIDIEGFAIDWVICGPETGRNARECDLAWIKNLHTQSQAGNIPFFDKSKNPLARELPWVKG